ncbi:GntR family transcriptional regulator [Planctomycetota bacterium]
MLIHIDYNSSEPIIHQVVGQVKWLVVGGKFQPGQKLPSIRDFARRLKINPTTVTRIYKELEHDGVIVLRQGQGAFVAANSRPTPKKEAKQVMKQKARELFVEGLRMGLDKDEIDQVLNDEYEKIRANNDD